MTLHTKLAAVRQIWQFDNRWHLLLQRLLFRHDAIGIYRLGGFQILVDHAAGDANGVPEVLTSSMYADHLAALTTRPDACVLDVGANAGGFPLLLARHGVHVRRLVSVELNPRTCIRLRFNLERNLRGDVRVLNAGLCGEARTLELALGEGSVADGLYAPSSNAAGGTTTVPGLTFDEIHEWGFGDELVDICKIDVEKAEYEVMDHAGHDRLRRCRLIVIEIHDVVGRSHRDVADAILQLDFEELPQGQDRSVHVFRNRALDTTVGR